jgi:hypothetical protein
LSEHNCPLCSILERKDQKLLYQDSICFVICCNKEEHKDIPMVVLNRHTDNPSLGEISYMYGIMKGLYPNRCARNTGMGSIKDHWHEHFIERRNNV